MTKQRKENKLKIITNLFVLVKEAGHVVADVLPGDVIFVHFWIVLLTFRVITRESLMASERDKKVELKK